MIIMRPEDYARSLFHLLDITSTPVDLEPICKYFNIAVKRVDLALVLGVLIKDRIMPVIAVNKNMTLPRQRFTLAHELGHFIMPHNSPIFACRDAQVNRWEREANRFAGELLMPQPLVERLWRKYEDNPEHRMDILAARLSVSGQALAIRLRGLGITLAEDGSGNERATRDGGKLAI